MFFESSKPVTGLEFFNRTKELAELVNTVELLKKGSTKYLALIGRRKTGKTSLLRQFMEVVDAPDVIFFEVDCWEKKPSPRIFFQDYLVQALDGFIRKRYLNRFHLSIRASLTNEPSLLKMLADVRSLKIASLDEATEKLLELRANHLSDTLFSSIIDFPEKLARETNVYFVSIIDEFQELTDLNRFKHIRENIGDIFALLRARWQRHQRVNYIIAGSKLTMMKEIITRERAPFFQHFKIIEIGDFDETDAKQMLTVLSEKAGNPIPQKLIDRLIELVGTNPFYLQILGGELCASRPQTGDSWFSAEKEIDENAFKITIQETLFNSMGRLYLYFQDLAGRAVGRSASLEQTLITIARHPGTLSSLASQMGIGTGTLKSWIDRVADFITVDSGIYQISDRCLRLWLENKSEVKPVLPPLVLGNEAEQTVARRMAQAGFELIYQSKASRGAFDLLAILQTKEVGVQVKKGFFPYYLKKDELQLMQHWAKQLRWKALFALVTEDDVYFYDVAEWKTEGQSYRIDETAKVIDNLLEFV
ncbi:ATP-binding protein [Candidatus Poribacteria bacterium]|nr:ATP-binding protein [Candidatus Poribacteria bacterium]